MKGITTAATAQHRAPFRKRPPGYATTGFLVQRLLLSIFSMSLYLVVFSTGQTLFMEAGVFRGFRGFTKFSYSSVDWTVCGRGCLFFFFRFHLQL